MLLPSITFLFSSFQSLFGLCVPQHCIIRKNNMGATFFLFSRSARINRHCASINCRRGKLLADGIKKNTIDQSTQEKEEKKNERIAKKRCPFVSIFFSIPADLLISNLERVSYVDFANYAVFTSFLFSA